MKFILPVLLVLVISGCSAHKPEAIQPYDTYTKLSQEAKYGDIKSHMNEYFTSTYLKEVNPSDKDSILLLKLTNYINKNISHFQSIKSGIACLTINGTDENTEPLTLHIEYKKISGKWLVNYMFLNFIENSDSYTQSAVCPREAEKRIMKLMHNKTFHSDPKRYVAFVENREAPQKPRNFSVW